MAPNAPDFSPWFPALVKPHRPGWYEILWAGFADETLPNGRWRWDGAVWRDDCNRIRELWVGDKWPGLTCERILPAPMGAVVVHGACVEVVHAG